MLEMSTVETRVLRLAGCKTDYKGAIQPILPKVVSFPYDLPSLPPSSVNTRSEHGNQQAHRRSQTHSLSLSSLAPNCIRLSEPGNRIRILCESVYGSAFMVITEWLTNPKDECFHTRKQQRTCLSLRLLLTLAVFHQVQTCCSWAFLFETSCTSYRFKILATRVK